MSLLENKPPANSPERPGLPWWHKAGWIAFAATILFIRKTDAFLHPQFWAEDSWPFFLQANTIGRACFWWEYNGYHHFLPRLIAWASAPIDPALQPAAFFIAALGVTLAIVAQALSSRLDLPHKPWLALIIVAVPHTGEVLLNVTNLQWITALGLLLTLLKRDPARVGDWLADVGLIAVAGLTGPFSTLFVPLFLVRAVQRKTVASWLVLGVAAIPALIQGWFIAHAAPLPDPGAFHLAGLVEVLWVRLVLTPFIGGPAAVILGRAGATILAGVLTLGLILVIGRKDRFRSSRWLLLAALVLVTLSAARRIRPDTWAFDDLQNGDRYFFVPKIIALWLVVLVIGPTQLRWLRRAGVAVLVVGFLANAPNFHIAPLPDLKWAEYCQKIRAGESVEIPVNPGWKITYPGRPR